MILSHRSGTAVTAAGLALAGLFLTAGAAAQPRLLDDFETVEGWKPVVSEGAKLTLGQGDGKSGKSLLMDFELSGGYGYVIARRAVRLDLAGDYRFTFDVRGETPVNNFEFKLVDSAENVWWIKKLNVDYPAIMGMTLFGAVGYVLINLVVDLLQAWIDPRISLN
jgi:hypothetical protein